MSRCSGPGVGAGIRKEDTELKDKINAAIKAIRANGKYDEITKKYFDFDIYGELIELTSDKGSALRMLAMPRALRMPLADGRPTTMAQFGG